MIVVFVSNFYNHHQSSFACTMDELTNHHFYFIETSPMGEGRKQMGWGQESVPAFVRQAYRSDSEKQLCKQLVDEADIVIWGGCSVELIRNRLRKKKLTFFYSERVFKKGFKGISYWGRALKHFVKHCLYRENHFLLCASAYAAGDYARIGLYRRKAFRWGYFPEVKEYDIDMLIGNKRPNTMLWAGRFIDWKQPEQAVEVAKKLKQDGIPFELNIIGGGPLKSTLRSLIDQYQLADSVHLLGFMRPEEVRQYMEQSEIYLFTSDQNEGWGAVLNESMNSGCVVIANEMIGSAPYLIRDGYNGITYNGSVDELYEKVKDVLRNEEKYSQMGHRGYETMRDVWNAKTAAQRLIQLAEKLQPEYIDGPASPEI